MNPASTEAIVQYLMNPASTEVSKKKKKNGT